MFRSKWTCTVPVSVFMLVSSVAMGATQQQVADYLVNNGIVALPLDTNLWMTAGPLDTTHVARDLRLNEPDIAFPFAQSWLVMIDDNPDANFGHPLRWVFVNDNLLQHSPPLSKSFPPAARAAGGAGPEVSLGCVSLSGYKSCPTTTPPGALLVVPGVDQSCLYAVLISGGIDNKQNAPRYAQNLQSMYAKLRGCGYPRANISVYYADGTKVINVTEGVNTFDIVTGSTSEINVRTKIQNYCATLDMNRDVLFIYTSNHGDTTYCNNNPDAACKANGECGGGGMCVGAKGVCLWDFNSNNDLDANELYTPPEFGADTAGCKVCRLFVLMDQCFAGEFAGIATDGMHTKMAFYAAALQSEPSWGREYMARWETNNPGTTTMDAMHADVVANGGLTSTAVSAVGMAGNGAVSLCFCWTPVVKSYRIHNNSGAPAKQLDLTFGGTSGSLTVSVYGSDNPCPDPQVVVNAPAGTASINYPNDCLRPNGLVLVREQSSGPGPHGITAGQWLDINNVASNLTVGTDVVMITVPTVSQWGLVILTLALLIAATILFAAKRQRSRSTPTTV